MARSSLYLVALLACLLSLVHVSAHEITREEQIQLNNGARLLMETDTGLYASPEEINHSPPTVNSASAVEDLMEKRIAQAVQKRNQEIAANRKLNQKAAPVDAPQQQMEAGADEPQLLEEHAEQTMEDQMEAQIYESVRRRNAEITAKKAAAQPAPVAAVTGLGDRVLIEADADAGADQAVEAEAVEALTTDGSVYTPAAAAKTEEHEDHSLLATETQHHAGLGLGVNQGTWAEPTYIVNAAHERAEVEAEEAEKEPEFVHPMLIQHEQQHKAAPQQKNEQKATLEPHHEAFLRAGAARYMGPLSSLPAAPPKAVFVDPIPPPKAVATPVAPAAPVVQQAAPAAIPASILAAVPAVVPAAVVPAAVPAAATPAVQPRFAQHNAEAEVEHLVEHELDVVADEAIAEAPATPAAPAAAPAAPAAPVKNMVAAAADLAKTIAKAADTVIAHNNAVQKSVAAATDADIVVPLSGDAESVASGKLYPDAPGPFQAPNAIFPASGQRSPQEERAYNVLNRGFTSPAYYPTKRPAKNNNGFQCRSSSSHPIQAPVFTSSFAPTPAYTCAVSPFISGQAWQSCHQQHETCYLSCQATQRKCDEQFQHCMMKSCGTGVYSSLCKKPEFAATNPRDSDKNYAVCLSHFLPLLTSRYFNSTSYNTCQSHACMCVSTPEPERVAPGFGIVLPPSALESWPFYVIPSAEQLALLEVGSANAVQRSQNLYESMDARDFVPQTERVGSNLKVAVADRPDVLAMSSASQVVGVDYSSVDEATPHVRAGLVIAKGKRILEHYVPTCARLAGGRQLGVFISYVGGDKLQGLPSHKLLMGVTQQGQGRGLIMTTNLIIQMFEDRIEVSNQWTPSLMTPLPGTLGVITVQIWSSVWEQQLFYSLIQNTVDRLNQAQVPVIFHTLDHAAIKNIPEYPTLLEETANNRNDPYVSAAESLLHAHATSTSGFWIESVSFSFPSSVVLSIKSTAPTTQRLNVEVRGWSEAHAHRNMSSNLALNMKAFTVNRAHNVDGEPVGSHPEEMFLGSLPIYSQRVQIELKDTIDSVFILTDLAAEGEEAKLYADQVFTNLGYFFHFAAGTDERNSGLNQWTAGVPESFQGDHSSIPQLFTPRTSQMQTGMAHFVTKQQDLTRPSNILLPGSGVMTFAHEKPSATGVVGVSRSLTPLSTGVDLSNEWGVSVLLRLLSPSPVSLQLQIESTSVTDYQFHKSPAIELETEGCWVHVQFPWSAFHAGNGRALDRTTIAKLTLVASVGQGREGEVSKIEVSSFAIQGHALTNAVRQVMARCSPTDNYEGSGANMQLLGGARARHAKGSRSYISSHMRRHSDVSDDILIEQPAKGAASTAAPLSLIAVAVSVVLTFVARLL